MEDEKQSPDQTQGEETPLTKEQSYLKFAIETNRDWLKDLIRRCEAAGHAIINEYDGTAACRVCGTSKGRYCERSPTKACHFVIDDDGHASCEHCRRP